jgi:hypothetical protein
MKPTKTITIKHNIDALIAACVGAIIIYWFAIQHGIGISPDSLTYTSVARNMQHGRFWYQFDGMPLNVFPCFYPSFLGSIMFITQHDIISIAPIINALLFAVVIFIVGCLAQQMVRNQLYKWLLLSCLLISASLIEIYSMLWSETLFIVLLLLLFVALRKYGSTHSITSLIRVSAIAAIACITRFAGVTFIAIVGLIILMDGQLVWRKKWWHLLVLGAGSLLPLIANLSYNYWLEGTLTGIRQKSLTPFISNLQFYGSVMCDWLHLPQILNTHPIFIGCTLFLALVVLMAKRCWQQQAIYSYQNIASAGFIVYVAFIVITSSISRYEPINNRLLSAAFIPMLLAISYWLPTALQQLKMTAIKWLATAACLTIVGLFQFQQYLWFKDWRGMVINYGIPGYTDTTWQQSPIVQFLQTQRTYFTPNIAIYANANDAVYFFSGLSCETVPESVHTEEIKDFYSTKPHFIVWFNNEFDNPNIVRLETIQQHRHLDTLKTFADGYILMSSLKK